jgi:hypothetical protein
VGAARQGARAHCLHLSGYVTPFDPRPWHSLTWNTRGDKRHVCGSPGVRRAASSGRWEAAITLPGSGEREQYLGTFATEKEAARAYKYLP